MSPEQRPQQASNERWPIGHSILERMRSEVNGEDGHFRGEEGEDVFRSLYLTERYGCIPDHLLGEDVLIDIRNLYYWTLDAVREELKERAGADESLWIVVDPSYDDSTYAVLITDENVLLRSLTKAWHFYWESQDQMAEELERWYQQAAARLMPAIETVANPPELTEAEISPKEKRFLVTLRMERLLLVKAPNKNQAVDRALAWESNEDTENVQFSYEELLGGIVETVEEWNEGESGAAEGGGNHHH